MTPRHAVALALLAVVSSCAAWAHEVEVPYTGALHRAWGIEEGLPQNSGWALAQTHDGHLYVGTQEGLVRFDGRTWVVKDQASGMPCDEVLALEPAPDGTLWVGTSCGLVRLAHGVLTHLPARPGAQEARVTALLRAPDSTVWVGTDQGLLHLGLDLRLTPVPGLGSEDVTSLAPAKGGAWVGTRTGGLWLARPGAAAERATPPGPGPLHQVTALAADGQDGVWVGTQGGGLWRHAPSGGFEPGPPGVPLRITALRAAHSGGLWVGTETEGFGRLQRARYERVEGVPPRAGVLAFLEDVEGSLWVGTFSAGVHQLRRPEVMAVGTKEGLADDFVWSVYEDHDGAVWIGSSGGAVHRWLYGQLTVYGAADGVPPGRVYDILRDRAGTLWLATTAGAARFHQGRFEPLTTKDGLPNDGVYTLFEDREGALWFGTRGGLARRKDGQWRVFTRADGLTRDNITNIRQAPDGGLWLGSPGGLDYLGVDGRVRAGGPEKGLAGKDVSGLVLDSKDASTVWAATDDGLARVKGTRLQVVRGRDGLPANNLLTVVDDGQGHLWVGTNRGLFRVAKSALEDFFQGRLERVHAVTYGRSEGMRSAECNSLSNASSLRTRSGELWFATVAGAVRVPPTAEPGARTPPPLHVTQVLSRGQRVDLARGLPEGALDVELHWAAPTFVSPEKVRYRYRLEPFDHDWVKAGERREAYYTNLPPGEYHFRVQAESTDARWEPVETGVLVRRPPRFFEAPGFHLLSGLGLAGAALGGYRWRVGRLRRRANELSARVRERTRELADANAELKRALFTSAESERSLRRLIDRLPIAITVYQDGYAVYANEASLKLLGFDSVEALAGRAMDLHVPDEERALWSERLQAVLRGEQLPERTARVVRGDGTVALAEVCGVALSFEGRQAVVSVARDVTEARRMEERLRLADRMASIGTLAAGVAHEINNPLSYVIGNQQFVLERLEPLAQAGPDATREVPVELLAAMLEALRDASEGAGRVRHIVRDLKTFSRGDEESTVPLEVWPVLESAVSMCHNEVRHRARLRREQGEVPRVLANEARLGQVFLNLLVNAAQAIPDGQVEQHEIVLATFTDAAGHAVVEVRDSGCGIPSEHLERIFDPFFTTKPLGVGTGLGLSICHGIITALGGELQVESTPGKGTCFRVVLPPSATQEEAMTKPQAEARDTQARDARRARLLVLDDEPLVARGVARLLAADYAAESACSARETLARLAQGERFDLMLCDLMMPEMSGEAFFKHLAEVAPDQREHVVFVTGGAFTPEAQHFLESLPPGRFVHKPLGAEALRALVREHLSRAA